MDALRGFASANGIDRLRLATGAGTRAARFYQRCGWTSVGDARDGEIEFEWFGPGSP